MKNNNNNHNEKKNLGRIVFGLLPNYIVKKKKKCCNIETVLQAIEEQVVRLCCNTIFCIVIEACAG